MVPHQLSQRVRQFFLTFFILCALFQTAFGQGDTSSVVTTFLYIDHKKLGKYETVAFSLKTPKRSAVQWASGRIQPVYQESPTRFLIKVDLPQSMLAQVASLQCTGHVNRKYGLLRWIGYKKEAKVSYGGINLSVIRLEINSTPKGAAVYMVPMRVWDKKFQRRTLVESLVDMEFFKVNTSLTNTHVRIDQTVFKIVFHKDGQFKTITHRPLPESIEPVQSVSVQF